MSFYPTPQPTAPPPSFALLATTFVFSHGARFTGLLEPAFFQRLAEKHRVAFGNGPKHTFNPAVTLWAWLSQVLSPAKSCTAAVARVLVLCACLNRPVCSADSSGYCKARAKLPTAFVRALTTTLGQQLEDQAPDAWKWRGHTVLIADGSLLRLPDTPENLADYPQQRSQKPGTSPTCMRVVLLLSLATGALRDAADGAYRGQGTGEMSLLRKIVERVALHNILLGDRYYGSYPLLALLQQRDAHGCFRLHAARQAAFGQGESLGDDDYLQTWAKPAGRPKWLTAAEWAQLPDTLCVRVLRVAVRHPGFRCREVFVGTTLLDPQLYPKEDVAQLYFDRWNGELDIRAIKQTLGLSLLTCQTPKMVRTELWVHLLAYNLVRCVMAEAAWRKELRPRQLSFSGAVQTLDAFRGALSAADPGADLPETLLTAVATHRVGKRPNRYEPREIKHQQRKYRELKKSRQERRAELACAGEAGAGGSGERGPKNKGRGQNRPSGRQR